MLHEVPLPDARRSHGPDSEPPHVVTSGRGIFNGAGKAKRFGEYRIRWMAVSYCINSAEKANSIERDMRLLPYNLQSCYGVSVDCIASERWCECWAW